MMEASLHDCALLSGLFHCYPSDVLQIMSAKQNRSIIAYFIHFLENHNNHKEIKKLRQLEDINICEQHLCTIQKLEVLDELSPPVCIGFNGTMS